jgi:hypothetical protein
MGRLLDKIHAQRAADLRICGKPATAGAAESATDAESCGLQNQIHSNPQSPQSIRNPKPAPDIAFHKSASPQRMLTDFAIQAGITHGLQLDETDIAGLILPSDLRDANKCTPEELKAWGAALALQATRERGIVPTGWDQIANCQYCGPVYSFAGGDCLACPWCEMKRAGKYVPVPT